MSFDIWNAVNTGLGAIGATTLIALKALWGRLNVHARAASGTTAAAANATVNVTVTWTTAFADTNYTVVATPAACVGGTMIVVDQPTKTASAVTLTLMNAPGNTSASSCTLSVVAIHD